MKNKINAVLMLSVLLLTGCAGVSLSTSSTLPAAEGTVKYKRSENDNTIIALKVKHLAQPEKLTPPASTYVVWTRANKDAEPQNIGALKVDDNLDGSLNGETPLHSFELFITAESSSQVKLPTGQPMLWTNYSR